VSKINLALLGALALCGPAANLFAWNFLKQGIGVWYINWDAVICLNMLIDITVAIPFVSAVEHNYGKSIKRGFNALKKKGTSRIKKFINKNKKLTNPTIA